MSRGFGKTIGRRIRIRQSDDASASCSGSSRLDPPSASSACTVRFTTPSTFNGTSSPDPHCGSFELKLPQSGKTPSRRHDAWRALALNACSIGYRDKAHGRLDSDEKGNGPLLGHSAVMRLCYAAVTVMVKKPWSCIDALVPTPETVTE